MCGIFGGIGDFDQLSILRAFDKLSKRGPDDHGIYRGHHKLILGHTRLAILDIKSGKQPLSSHDKRYTICFNGEIYNHNSLRLELEKSGAKFQTSHSDTEVIVEAYRLWGPNCVVRFDGMFAFAIHDDTTGELFLARDKLGQKPLFFQNSQGKFAFASQLDALKALTNETIEFHELGLAKYLYYGFVPAPFCIDAKAKKLKAGQWLKVNKYGQEIEKFDYYSYRNEPSFSGSFSEAVEECSYLLDSSVKAQLAADVEVGILLSGGIDSSLISHCAGKYSDSVKSFNLSFFEESYDESEFAKLVANQTGMSHVTKEFEWYYDDASGDNPFSNIDEPILDPSLLPTDQVCKLATKHVKVVLGGDGADELFFGYNTFQAVQALNFSRKTIGRALTSLAKPLQQLLPISSKNFSLDLKARRFLRGAGKESHWATADFMSSFTLSEINSVLSKQFSSFDIASELIELENRNSRDPYGIMGDYFTNVYLPNNILTKSDRASMSNSLEVRSPFLSNALLDFAASLPNEYKFSRKNETKSVLRSLCRQNFSDVISERPKKGFGIPLLDITRKIKQPDFSLFPMNEVALSSIFQEHNTKRLDRRYEIFNLYALHCSLENKI